MKISAYTIILCTLVMSCSQGKQDVSTSESDVADSTQLVSETIVEPKYVSEKVKYDTDDPAIYIDRENLENSFIIGTDKDQDGGLYAFNFQGKIITDKIVYPLRRPNNIDVEYGLTSSNMSVDIAVTTERFTNKIRIYSLPDMKEIDNGGIPVFEGETGEEFRDPMGVSCYRNAETGKVYAIVGRKNGPQDGTYLWQYELQLTSNGTVTASLVRKFGNFTGLKEIEAIAVDDQAGYVYYSEEQVGIRKYHAEPDAGNDELALFGRGLFADDNEGIAIYATSPTEGYIFVSDQGAGKLQVFQRESGSGHDHTHLGHVNYKALETDGIEITNQAVGSAFPKGVLVAMSTDQTFHVYDMQEILSGIIPAK